MKISNARPDLMDMFGRHLVGLFFRVFDVVAGVKATTPRRLIFPGAVLHTRETYFFLTAGHILQQIDSGIKSGKLVVDKSLFIDMFGMSKKTDYPIPFDYEASQRLALVDDERCLDLGLILLTDYYVRLFKANNILPIEDTNWMNQPSAFDRFYALGFPTYLYQDESEVPTTLNPALVPIAPIDDVPAEIMKGHPERFYGKALDESLPDLDGMSGSPIFAFGKERPGKYWLVAIQTSWYRERRIVVGCRTPLIGYLVSSTIDKLNSGEQPPNTT